MSSQEQATGEAASRLIDQGIVELGGWRGETLARMQALILEADPEMIEEWKWMGTPVWSHNGIVCTGESYTKVVKVTFAKEARVPDPSDSRNFKLHFPREAILRETTPASHCSNASKENGHRNLLQWPFCNAAAC